MTGTERAGAHVVGAHIDAVDFGDCLNHIFEWAERHESRYICLCNAHSVVTARQDAGFSRILNEADLAVPDGAPVAWRLGTLGYPGQPRISGSELMWKSCARAAGSGVSIFLYGSGPETLRRLSARLVHEFPRLTIAGCYSPPFRPLTPGEDTEGVKAINDSGAGIVFVSLGCPKQETWMAEHRGRISAVMVGVGAAFEFHAGTMKRAPRWMQDMGLEWLHRLMSEPRRLWRRYFVTNSLFLAFLAVESLAPRRGESKR